MSEECYKTSCNLIILVILLMETSRIMIIMIIPIDVTLVGIVTDVREVRPNAASPFIVVDNSSNNKIVYISGNSDDNTN